MTQDNRSITPEQEKEFLHVLAHTAVIEFRAWHKVPVTTQGKQTGTTWEMHPVVNIELSSGSVNTARGSFPYNLYNTDLIILMQYSGINDDAGNKIFAGDIVQYELQDLNEKDTAIFTEVVSFKDGSFLVDNYAPLYVVIGQNSKVVGNIFENPNLIKQ